MVPTCSVVGDIEKTGAIEDIVEDSRKWIVTPSNDSSQYYKYRTRVPPPILWKALILHKFLSLQSGHLLPMLISLLRIWSKWCKAGSTASELEGPLSTQSVSYLDSQPEAVDVQICSAFCDSRSIWKWFLQKCESYCLRWGPNLTLTVSTCEWHWIHL